MEDWRCRYSAGAARESGLTTQRITQVVVSIGALGIAVLHLVIPQLTIDGITLVLIPRSNRSLASATLQKR